MLASQLLWGLFPFYFSALRGVPAVEVLAHRILWSAVLTVLVLALMRRLPVLFAALRDRRLLLRLLASSVCVGANWGLFIWAVVHDQALEASIAYFISPLITLMLAFLVLHERLSPRQWAAVLLVTAGVGSLAVGLGRIPWLVVVLPLGFAFYSLIRKVAVVDSVVGLAVETLLLAPVALAYVLFNHGGALVTGSHWVVGLLIACGPVTALPLVLFTFAARRLELALVGLLQYVSPSVQMLIATLALGESFTVAHLVTFGFIWSGLVLYSLPGRRAG